LYYANEIIYALHETLEGKDTNVHSNDCISRRAAIDEAEKWIKTYNSGRGGQREQDAIKHVISGIKKLPSAQPEPAIPISWLEKEVEHLESRENSFAVLDAMQLKALIKRWRGEQDDTE
jgi:hypothetical protein